MNSINNVYISKLNTDTLSPNFRTFANENNKIDLFMSLINWSMHMNIHMCATWWIEFLRMNGKNSENYKCFTLRNLQRTLRKRRRLQCVSLYDKLVLVVFVWKDSHWMPNLLGCDKRRVNWSYKRVDRLQKTAFYYFLSNFSPHLQISIQFSYV